MELHVQIFFFLMKRCELNLFLSTEINLQFTLWP